MNRFTMHFQAHNIMTAIAACEAARQRYGFEYRIESGNIITSTEPEFRVNEVLDRFNEMNTK
jgi:hypothetical protein